MIVQLSDQTLAADVARCVRALNAALSACYDRGLMVAVDVTINSTDDGTEERQYVEAQIGKKL